MQRNLTAATAVKVWHVAAWCGEEWIAAYLHQPLLLRTFCRNSVVLN
jgi:hypothetical protein